MLYIGEEVGSGKDDAPEVDIAVDPLEGTTICATGGPNAIACVALAKRGDMLHAPDTYMYKMAVGPDSVGAIDIRRSVTENLFRIAARKDMPVNALTVCILQRERHKDIIEEVRKAGARIRLIQDGDVSAAIATAIPSSPVDVLVGIGGAPEGVLAAAALRALGGEIQGQLRFRSVDERERAIAMGLSDPNKVFSTTDLVSGEDAIFAATGVTDGDFLEGVRFRKGGAISHSVVMRVASGTMRFITAHHDFIRGRMF
jgi:fructose-1,6-bisphosphatase II